MPTRDAEILKTLQCLRNLLPGHWTQGDLACAADRRPVHPKDSAAEKFCLIGGMWRCFGTDVILDHELETAVEHELASCLKARGAIAGVPFDDVAEILSWNDDADRTEAEVLSVVDSCIDHVKERSR